MYKDIFKSTLTSCDRIEELYALKQYSEIFPEYHPLKKGIAILEQFYRFCKETTEASEKNLEIFWQMKSELRVIGLHKSELFKEAALVYCERRVQYYIRLALDEKISIFSIRSHIMPFLLSSNSYINYINLIYECKKYLEYVQKIIDSSTKGKEFFEVLLKYSILFYGSSTIFPKELSTTPFAMTFDETTKNFRKKIEENYEYIVNRDERVGLPFAYAFLLENIAGKRKDHSPSQTCTTTDDYKQSLLNMHILKTDDIEKLPGSITKKDLEGLSDFYACIANMEEILQDNTNTNFFKRVFDCLQLSRRAATESDPNWDGSKLVEYWKDTGEELVAKVYAELKKWEESTSKENIGLVCAIKAILAVGNIEGKINESEVAQEKFFKCIEPYINSCSGIEIEQGIKAIKDYF